MYCPKCKHEYREGFTECADCGVPLVEKLPTEAEERRRQLETPGSRLRQVLLVVTADDARTASVAEALRNEGITAYILGRAVTGDGDGGGPEFSAYGDDIYVDGDDYDRAAEALARMPRVEAVDEEWDDEEDYEEESIESRIRNAAANAGVGFWGKFRLAHLVMFAIAGGAALVFWLLQYLGVL